MLTERRYNTTTTRAWVVPVATASGLCTAVGVMVAATFGLRAVVGFLGGALLILLSVGISAWVVTTRKPSARRATALAFLLMLIKLPMLVAGMWLIVGVADAPPLAVVFGVLVGPTAWSAGALVTATRPVSR